MKVIQVLNSWEFSGAENVAVGIIDGLSERGHEGVYVSRKGIVEESLRQRGVRFIGLDKVSVRNVRRVIREERADVVHAHDIYAGMVCSLATIGTECRLVTTLHNNGFENRRVSLKSLLYLVALIRTRWAFFVSKSCYEGYVFHKWFEKKSEVLGNIIDVENVIKVGKDVKKKWDLVFVGRLTYQKDPLRLVRVMRMICDVKPDMKAAIVGYDDMMEETRDEVKRLGLELNVEMMGFRSDALEIMAASRVMLMTSRWEGTPMAALEAMTLKVPIVSTPVDGMKEIMDARWLSDDDEELTRKVIDILDNGCEGYVWYECLSKEAYMDRIMSAYEQ